MADVRTTTRTPSSSSRKRFEESAGADETRATPLRQRDGLMSVLGGNSVANLASLRPRGIGVNQAFNVASLRGVTSPANAQR